MFPTLLKKHGGRLMTPSSQEQFVAGGGANDHFKNGVCAALGTLWIAKRAQGRDFFKYLESASAKVMVTQLQGRESFLSDAGRSTARYVNKLPGLPPGEYAAKAKLQNQFIDLLGEERKNQHQWRCDYIRDETGLTGFIKKHADLDNAMTRTTGIEGYTIVDIANRNGRGHTVAVYTSLHGGVRFYDPNHGEVFFESTGEFEPFLAELTRVYVEDMEGGMKHVETTSIPAPFFPKSPEDSEVEKGFLSLNLTLEETIELKEAQSELQPLLES
jgi:hypothetical protein